MRRLLMLMACVLICSARSDAAAPHLTAVTVYATDIDGNLNAGERWNTIATHPAWDVWVKDGALPGKNILNTTAGKAPDRWVDIPLSAGENTFSFGVEHFADLCCEGYGLNLFINGSPTAANGEEKPQLTAWSEPDRNLADGVRPEFRAQAEEGTSMGFPLQTFPPAFLDYEGDGFEIEVTDFVIYSNQAGWDIDVQSQRSAVGPFIPDGRPDVVGQFTLNVTLRNAIAGDFNGNNVLDATDIDLLSTDARLGTNTPRFDLNLDKLVNQADREKWVNELRKTYFGDANLDGQFNSSDFVFVFAAGQYEDSAVRNSGWAQGDWNGDAEFNSSDFVTAFQSGGYEQGPRAAVASVPEPGTLTLVLLSLSGLVMARKRR